ncbi:RND family efflux transporter, MFP subunit [Spirosomataceae bacterium TFI 002]|nr:RND family efflux transporter, MFP subunit [Spirosomataceae bacterium TFI 002]
MRLAISIVLGIALLVGAYFLSQKIGNSKTEPKGKPNKTTNLAYVKPVINEDISITVETNGTIKAQERIELFSEVQGVFQPSSKAFKPGQRFAKGDLLLSMDSQEFYSSLVAQRSILYDNIVKIMPDLKFDYPASFSQWQKYLDNFDIQQNIKDLPKPLNEKEKYYINGNQIVSNFYSIKNLEERMRKYKIYAPFSGILTEALVEQGTLIRSGQKLGTLINTNVFELEANINAEYLKYLTVGKRVSVKDLNGEKSWPGFIKRINGVINPATQTVQAFIQISGSGLTEGQFLEATISANSEPNVIEISRSLLFNEDHVFVVKNDSVLTSEQIQPVHFTDKLVMIRGLANGTEILTKAIPGAYDGMIVKKQNEIAQ